MNDKNELLNVIQHCSYQEVLKNIPDNSIDVLLTDPPYNIKIEGEKWDVGFDFNEWLSLTLPKIKEDGMLLIFNTKENVDRKIKPFIEKFEDETHNFTVVDIIEWGKTNPRQNVDIYRQYEFLLVAYNNYGTEISDREYSEDDSEYFTNEIWETASEIGLFKIKGITHPTVKPIRLIEKLLVKLTEIDDVVLDTTSGSGSIAIACWDTRRDFIACEIDEGYANNSQKRLEKIKGQVPRTVFLFDLEV
ncbi:site-specific DNA-methyltransferase [Enterococcus plantarum]|uniref:DNA-methyltransferase n=1 Tax=Enterococcus plantarum TaxID=1077675 RepID=UPI001A8C2D0B|nr:site-specific DNA-methyltransferase [Enterococcus plantarum]MBO0467482.1 site-specific DNA-methyltransferase [Enterococcus plantarum]